MKRILAATAFLICAATATAQHNDTLTAHYDHTFRLKGIAVPAVLIASGATISETDLLHARIDVPIQQWTQRDGHGRNEIENIFQYAPLAAVPVLKLCGVESRHCWRDLASLTGGAAILSFAFSTGIKSLTGTERPHGDVYNSFPSGHTTTAFMGAEILRREYGGEHPGIAVAGYAVAAGVGCMRVYNNRHWASDVLAGAGFGILSASIMYWIGPYLRF